jgi:ubiquinone/menaquinone biosynthesis C-methylase UbiE
MRRNSPYRGTLRHVRANWPGYVLLYAGVVLALLLIGLSLDRGWFSFVPLSLALLLLLAYFFVAGLWTAHQLYDPAGLRPHVALFEMGRLNPEESFVYVDLGVRDFAIQLSRRLSSGKIIVVDVYNPQWATGTHLQRYRTRQPQAPNDPRLVWQNGRFDLIPLPDKSISTVILCQVLSEFWQEGDRAALLHEVQRVMAPNGKVLLAERVRSQANWLVLGPTAVRLPTADYWRESLQTAGFMVRGERDLQGLIYCFRADKPSAAQARQLALNLPL